MSHILCGSQTPQVLLEVGAEHRDAGVVLEALDVDRVDVTQDSGSTHLVEEVREAASAHAEAGVSE